MNDMVIDWLHNELKDAASSLLRVKDHAPQRSIVYYGSEKSGKTSLLRSIKHLANSCEMACYSIAPDSASTQIDGLVDLGKAAAETDGAICILVDDIHKLQDELLLRLCSAIHRCNQLRLPVIAFCAGRPQLLKKVGNIYPDAERLFLYRATKN